MPQSLANLLVHLVFSTKDRAAWLEDEWRDGLHGYIGGVVRRCGSTLLAANSVGDHIHLLFPLPRTVSISDLVREIKTGATGWIRERTTSRRFHWQAGYGAFSVSPGHKEGVVRYIAGQQEHHRKVTFQEEYRRLLAKYGIEFDERYVWAKSLVLRRSVRPVGAQSWCAFFRGCARASLTPGSHRWPRLGPECSGANGVDGDSEG